MPILAIYIINNINGGSAEVAGIAGGIYWIVKSILQLPIARYLDKHHNEKDDYHGMLIGGLISAWVPIGLLYSSEIWQLYSLQAIYGLGMALCVPAWGGIFIRHMDKGKEASTWSIESSLLGIGIGLAGITGGILVSTFGFIYIFLLVSTFGALSVIALLFIHNNVKGRDGIIIFHK